jgi:tRNA pseudouridine13 synthase
MVVGEELSFWSDLSMPGLRILEVQRHARKLKHATHAGNRFRIIVTEFSGDKEALLQKVEQIRQFGVPNYFGAQRFGVNYNNMPKAFDLLVYGKKVKKPHLRGLLFSSARAWLFNSIVSHRIGAQSYNSLFLGEPVNLNGSNSFFTAQKDQQEGDRLQEMDIHPTAPLWGKHTIETIQEYSDLHEIELNVVSQHSDLVRGLEKNGLQYQRRAIRTKVDNLECQFEGDHVEFAFELGKGQYATSVLRELIRLR